MLVSKITRADFKGLLESLFALTLARVDELNFARVQSGSCSIRWLKSLLVTVERHSLY